MNETGAKIPVAVLGATGVVGQRFVRRLARHPRFAIRQLAASERSAGRRYRDACTWRLPGEPWAGLGDLEVVETSVAAAFAPVVFSALDAATAREIEPALARAGAAVFSNASAFRMEDDVPLVVPEVNPESLALLDRQRRERGWPGSIVCNPNCTAAVLVTALAPLERAFGIEALLVATMQAASGAGLPGVPSLDLLGNVVPYIRGEEEKVAEEVGKLLGRVDGERIEPARFPVSAACHRVPVVDGHTEAVSLRLRGDPPLALVREALERFEGEPQRLRLHSAPAPPLVVHEAPDRPQPRLDVDAGDGMTVHVGRLRPCPVLGVRMTVLGSNVERGAAGASVLDAELALATERLPGLA
ncbi:MAG: aspartate-semialdehyde dehydrogenase [Acidobacteria bacterium]|nr:aspartate-semialdehyde dehydrogenase [Acidobacteriota bacterium]